MKILENIIRANQQNNVGFDFTKSASRFPYYNKTNVTNLETGEDLPISPEESEWLSISDGNKNYMKRSYHFKSTKLILYFFNEPFNYL